MTREGRRVNKEENRDYGLKSTQLQWLSYKPGLEPTGIQGRLHELHSSYEKEENIPVPQKYSKFS